MATNAANFVVIGSGLAGYGVVREVRRLVPDAVITVITRDDGHFYSKPALSTALAKSKTPATLVTMPAEKMIATHQLVLKARANVSSIDRVAKTVRVADERVSFDRLILATGAAPMRLRLEGNAADAPFSINSLDDYGAFHERLGPGVSVAIIGAGLVGCEFANDLSHRGHPVTVIDPLPIPLAQLVPPAVGEALRDALAAQGVSWRLATSVTAIDDDTDGYRLTLSDAETLRSSLVLSAVGLRPETELARAAGLAVDRGVQVDEFGRTSDPDIFAIGDCAQYPHGLSAFVTPIMTAARAIAATATGAPTSMRFPALSVQVKTSACPLVLLPPSPGVMGSWVLAERGEGEKYLFLKPDGTVSGYAMTGVYCDQRVDLDRAIATQEGIRDVA